MKPLVVLVEDDPIISELVEFNLVSEGYEVRSFRDGKSLLNGKHSLVNPVLFILDIMLPDQDGFEICSSIKSMTEFDMIPIIMLTARAGEKDKVKALDLGADDYITKPFGVREFLARVNTNVRRYMKQSKNQPSGEDPLPVSGTGSGERKTIGHAGIRLDDERHRVYKNEDEIEITHREYELLKFLILNRGIAFSREDLLSKVWGYEYAGETRTVDVHIRQLRRKIEADDAHPQIIETVRGRGYRFTER
jgi:two-component system, OmpR family, alkaline phosphatase synthesis response regulator PhoP